MRHGPMAHPTRSVASSERRIARHSPDIALRAGAIAGTATVITTIAADGATVALRIPRFDIP